MLGLGNSITLSTPLLASSLLLENVAGAAMAVSLRKIDSTYSGSCIKVRRDSDNTLLDIGFLANGELDVSALTTFVNESGAGNGFVNTWYDQSGSGNNATTADPTDEPRIVASGVYDGAVKYTPAAHNLNLLNIENEHTIFYVLESTDTHALHFQSNAAGGNFLMLAVDGNANPPYSAGVGTLTYHLDGAVQSWTTRDNVSDGIADGAQHLVTIADINIADTTWDPMYLGDYGGFPISPTLVSELIVYPSNLITADQEAVELDITTHYSL